jgi:serine/threonine protein kinase
MDHDRDPRLADFGLVRLSASMTVGAMTQTTNGFDLRWSSPQRLEEDERSIPDDVYSFGCVCYYVSAAGFYESHLNEGHSQLYSGMVPFEGPAEAKTAILVMRGERPPRPSRGEKCILEPNDSAWAMISRCWSQERERRPVMSVVCGRLQGRLATEPPEVRTPDCGSTSGQYRANWDHDVDDSKREPKRRRGNPPPEDPKLDGDGYDSGGRTKRKSVASASSCGS